MSERAGLFAPVRHRAIPSRRKPSPLIGKLPLLGYRDGDLAVRHPVAQTFALLAEKMAGARAVSRVTAAGPPGLHAFEVDPGRAWAAARRLGSP
ncbi:MAG: hypothetical protein ACRDPF_06155 [Streptosporangiaceae bacterium]